MSIQITTPKEIITLMEKRGYKKTAEGNNGDSFFFLKKIDDTIHVHALARVSRLTVELDIIGSLEMGCKIATQGIVIDSNAFNKTEETLIRYGKVLIASDSEKPVPTGRDIIEEKKVEKTIDERKKDFWEEIREEGKAKGYEKEMCQKFFRHWSEYTDNKKWMRWEVEKRKKGTFQVRGRLVTWLTNDKLYYARYKAKTPESFADIKAKKQDEELAQVGKNHISTKDLF